MGKSVSHAWIALHRCVEANARLTGEPFRSIFSRLESLFSFKRTDTERWPDLDRIRAAAKQLERERNLFLEEYNALIDKRKREKRQGKRLFEKGTLRELCERQNKHNVPKVGFWGWRAIRDKKDKIQS